MNVYSPPPERPTLVKIPPPPERKTPISRVVEPYTPPEPTTPMLANADTVSAAATVN
jgi:hypothetical protein